MWVDEPIIVKDEFHENFQSQCSKLNGPWRRTDSSYFFKLSDSQIQFLQAPFINEEIKKTVWDCGSTKAPGLDGFTFIFIKRY